MFEKKDQFDIFFTRYIRIINPQCVDNANNRLELKYAIQYIEQHIHDYINIPLMLSTEPTSIEASISDWRIWEDFLKSCMLTQGESISFNNERAEHKKDQIAKQLNRQESIIASQRQQTLSIVSKFNAGTLSDDEWLTDLDLQQICTITNTKDKIIIAELEPSKTLAELHFAREKYQNSTTSYTIYLLLNVGGNHWISATILVVDKTLTPTLTDPMGFAHDHSEIIKQALTYEDKDHKAFPAKDGWIIQQPVIRNQNQPDGYSCGYRALHNLFQDQELIGDNDIAQSYSRTDATNSRNLVTAFYTALNISTRRQTLTPHKQLSYEKKREINLDIAEPIRTINQLTQIIIIPTDEKLCQIDYHYFFDELQSKIGQRKTRLATLKLPPTTINNLQQIILGLKSHTLNLATMLIEISPNHDSQLHYIQLITQLSKAGVQIVTFLDNNKEPTQYDWQKIANAVNFNQVKLTINLPKHYANTSIQRTIDNITIYHFTDSHKKTNQNISIKSKKIRSRTRQKNKPFSGLILDVEMAQEVQVAIAVQQEKHIQVESPATYEVEGLNWDQITQLILDDKISLPHGTLCISDMELKNSWHKWLCNITDSNGQVKNKHLLLHSVSLEAAEKLLKFQHLFQAGINCEHLPAGFSVVINHAQQHILHYNADSINSPSKIAPCLLEKPLPYALSPQFVEKIVAQSSVLNYQWNVLQTSEVYSRDTHTAFRRYLPTLLHFNEQLLAKLFLLCTNQEELNATKLQVFVDNYQTISTLSLQEPSTLAQHNLKCFANEWDKLIALATEFNASNINTKRTKKYDLSFNEHQLDAILGLEDKYGHQGIQLLFPTNIDKQIIQDLLDTIFRHAPSFIDLVENDDLFDAYHTLQGMLQNTAQYRWWSVLLQQHAQAVGYDDLPSLLNAFLAFSKKIQDFDLDFYEEVHFKDTLSLPTTLAHIISLMDHCHPEERKIMWSSITKLSLGAHGAIRACMDKQYLRPSYYFALPEMLLTQEEYSKNAGYDLNKDKYIALVISNSSFNAFNDTYIADDDWRNIGPGSQRSDKNIDKKLAVTVGDFYRYLAAQEHRFPLSYYKNMDDKINNASSLDDINQSLLYALLAGGTTGEINRKICMDEQIATTAFEKIIQLCSNFTQNSIFNMPLNFLLQSALSIVAQEDNALPLTILEHVMRSYLSIMKWQKIYLPNQFVTNIKMFATKSKRFIQLAQDPYLAVNLYKGMSCYTSNDYEQNAQNQEDEPVLFRHSSVLDTICNQTKCELIQVISQFNLIDKNANIEEIKNIIHAICPNKIDSKSFRYAFDLLSNIKKPGLQANDLIIFLKLIDSTENCYIYPSAIQAISEMIEKQFATYFESDFFSHLREKDTPDNILLFLNNQGENTDTIITIQKILKRFTKDGEANLHFELSVAIIACIKKITLYKQKAELLRSFHTLITAEELPINKFIELINIINTTNGLHDYMYFMDKAAQTTDKINNLGTKVLCYLQNILPLLARNNMYVDRLVLLNLSITIIITSDVQHITAVKDNTSFAIYTTLKNVCDKDLDVLTIVLDNHSDCLQHDDKISKLHSILKNQPNDNSRINLVITEAKLEIAQKCIASTPYPDIVINIMRMIDSVVAKYPGDASLIISYLKTYLLLASNIETKWQNIQDITREFLKLNDADIVRSLCTQFDDKSGPYSHNDLLKLLQTLNNQQLTACSHNSQHFWINLVTLLANNEIPCNLDNLYQLILIYEQQSSYFQQTIQSFYNEAPYPSVDKIIEWCGSAQNTNTELTNTELIDHLLEQYTLFDRVPNPREEENGFDFAFAKTQACKFNPPIKHNELEKLNQATQDVRELSTSEIKNKLQNSDVTIEELIASVAELLYRSKSMPMLLDNNKRILGRSFEINTTQYLALYAILKSGRHVTAEIETSEGKSRISMLLLACLWIKKNKVNFISSNIQLVMRDYLAFKAFFKPQFGVSVLTSNQRLLLLEQFKSRQV